MGYLKKKYTKKYFLGASDEVGAFGVEGCPEFKQGRLRDFDQKILNQINFRRKRVLELGYGRGEALKYALEHGASQVVGIDFARASQKIAAEFLAKYGYQAELYCEDAIVALKQFVSKPVVNRFDIVVMLDFIEHVPRHEVRKILDFLRKITYQKAIVIINTPVYPVDNDVLLEGLKTGARDTGDEHEATQGMHCNRYTLESLIQFMKEANYDSLSGHYFVPHALGGVQDCDGANKWRKYHQKRYPIVATWREDAFEHGFRPPRANQGRGNEISDGSSCPHRAAAVYSPSDLTKKPSKKETLRGFSMNPNLLKEYQLDALKIEEEPTSLRKDQSDWFMIKNGILKGRSFLVDPADGWRQKEILQGTREQFFFNYLRSAKIRGKTIFEIGGDIGYHTLNLAALVGAAGKVIVFEPNIANIGRFITILKKNEDLAEKIVIIEWAVADQDKQEAHLAKFPTKKVSQIKLDQLSAMGIKDEPFLIKIDIEGGEEKVLKGAQQIISQYKPLIFIEVHSILSMYQLPILLGKMQYSLKLLNENQDGRCFFVAYYQPNKLRKWLEFFLKK